MKILFKLLVNAKRIFVLTLQLFIYPDLQAKFVKWNQETTTVQHLLLLHLKEII